MTSGQDVSEFLGTLGQVKSYFFYFFENFFLWCSDAPEDQAICLVAGLLANPDMPLSPSLPLSLSLSLSLSLLIPHTCTHT
jgi:hypothetical protein